MGFVNFRLMQNNESKHLLTTGGCQCGAKRYAFTGKWRGAEICHCRMCQKAFGNWGAAFIEVPFANLRWQSESPDVFRSSLPVQRLFCRLCGTPLGMQEDGDDTIDIAAGTLDDPSGVVFSRQIGIECRLPWFAQLHLLPEVKTQDTRPAAELARLKSNQHKDED